MTVETNDQPGAGGSASPDSSTSPGSAAATWARCPPSWAWFC
jgi:hypothetical protein